MAYKTNDLGLSTTLSTLGFPLLNVDRTEKRAAFVFDDSERLQEIVKAYFRRELSVEPQLYHANSRIVKTMLYGNV